MYSEDLKQRYIDWKMSRTSLAPHFLSGIFSKSENFEEDYQKDVCNFTVREIIDMYKTISYNNVDMLLNANSALAGYTDWCIDQGFVTDRQNHFREIDTSILASLTNKAIRQMRIVSRQQVVKWCDQLDNPACAFIILGLFEGLNGQHFSDFYQLMRQDIDVESKTINVPGRGKMIFSTKLCELGIESADVHDKSNPKADPERVIKDYRNVRDTDDPRMKSRRIYNKILLSFKELGILDLMNAQAIVDAGMVDYIKTESRRLNMDTIQFATDHLGDINFRFCKSYKYVSNLLKRVGDFI